MSFLPLAVPFVGEDEKREMMNTLNSGTIATGPKTEQFQTEFASYIGRKHAIGTDSCTNALHISLAALDIGPGDEVITTPMTFVATANSIVYTGATPVFVDVEPDTLNIDPAQIEKALTRHTRAIVPVHLYGHPCDMDRILEIARKHNLKVVSDCAHAIEAEYQGKKIGSLGDVACYSFYATKNLATGNGGMLVTDDPALADLTQVLRDHGMSAGAWARYQTGEFKHYGMTHLGYKCIMWDLPACLGLHQLRRIEARHKRRLELAAMYRRLLEPLADQVTSLHPRPDVRHAHHLYPVLLKGLERDRVAAQMEGKGIGAGVHYRPVHLEPFYRERFGHHLGEFPVAEQAGDNLLSLPFWPEMKDEDVKRVATTLGSVVRESGKRLADAAGR